MSNYTSSSKHSQYDLNNNNNYYPNNAPQFYYNNSNAWNPSSATVHPYQTQTGHTFAANNNQSSYTPNYKPATTLRPRYPQLPAYDPNNSVGPTSFYSNIGNYGSFNSSGNRNSGRSNCFSPTYTGLTEVLASYAPGSTVLYLEPKRASRFCSNLKLKYILLICLALILISILAMTLFGLYTGSGSGGLPLSPVLQIGRKYSKVEFSNDADDGEVDLEDEV